MPDLYGTFAPTYQSLFRFDVNAATNSWNKLGLFDVLNVINSRSVQIADQVYFLNGGLLSSSAW